MSVVQSQAQTIDPWLVKKQKKGLQSKQKMTCIALHKVSGPSLEVKEIALKMQCYVKSGNK